MTRHGIALNARPASKCQKEGASVCSLGGIHTFLQTFFQKIVHGEYDIVLLNDMG
mgnify:CR=1 FL=1